MKRLSIFAPGLYAAIRPRMVSSPWQQLANLGGADFSLPALLPRAVRAGALLLALNAVAFGSTFTFDTDPLAGTGVRSAPGRQLVGGEQFIPFETARDVFAFASLIFGGNDAIDFANGPTAAIPATDVNVAVLQTLDDDNNPLTPFGAFNAADLLASRITEHGPGVFVFFNQDLALPELVYSDDLASNQADLKVLARMLNLNGQPGINAFRGFQRPTSPLRLRHPTHPSRPPFRC